jgi:pullulanase
LHRLRPDVIIYGEGWTAGQSPLPDSVRALKKNVARLHGIAVFGDDMRDGIKGSVFDAKDRGFIAGNLADTESVKFGIVAACPHPQIDYSKVNYSKAAFASAPSQVITYCECHDNNTLWDKLGLSALGASVADRARMQRLAHAIVLTSQGIPFLYEGTEFFHSKRGIDNSYNVGDSINAIDWGANIATGDDPYVQTLIRMRRDHPAFRMSSAASIAGNLHFLPAPPGCIVYRLDGAAVHDPWASIIVIFNGTGEQQSIPIPLGQWGAVKTDRLTWVKDGIARVDPYSAIILHRSY